MNVRRPEWDEQPSNRSARYAVQPAQHSGAAIPGLEVDEMAHQNALIVRSIFERANRLHEMLIRGGGSNGFVKEIVEVMGNGPGGMRFFTSGSIP